MFLDATDFEMCYSKEKKYMACTRDKVEKNCGKDTADVYIHAMKKINVDPCASGTGNIYCICIAAVMYR